MWRPIFVCLLPSTYLKQLLITTKIITFFGLMCALINAHNTITNLLVDIQGTKTFSVAKFQFTRPLQPVV